VVTGTDFTGTCKFNYHTNTTTTAPRKRRVLIFGKNSVIDCCLRSSEQIVCNIVVRTNYISWKWWWYLHCTSSTRLVELVVLVQWSYNMHVAMSLQSDTLSWFRLNQSLLLLLNYACSAEMQTIPILVFILTRQWLELTIYPTRGKDANHYSTDVVKLSKLK
jgi:hypothetical protein